MEINFYTLQQMMFSDSNSACDTGPSKSCDCLSCRVKSAPVPEFRRNIERLQRVHALYEHASALEKVHQQMDLINWVSRMRDRLEKLRIVESEPKFNPNAKEFVPTSALSASSALSAASAEWLPADNMPADNMCTPPTKKELTSPPALVRSRARWRITPPASPTVGPLPTYDFEWTGYGEPNIVRVDIFDTTPPPRALFA